MTACSCHDHSLLYPLKKEYSPSGFSSCGSAWWNSLQTQSSTLQVVTSLCTRRSCHDKKRYMQMESLSQGAGSLRYKRAAGSLRITSSHHSTRQSCASPTAHCERKAVRLDQPT